MVLAYSFVACSLPIATMILIVLAGGVAEKRAGAPPVESGSIVTLDDGPRRSSFFCFQVFAEICLTEVSPGHVRLIEYRMIKDGSLQIGST